MEREDEAYVHEAFLADWRPGTSKVSSTFPDSGLQEKSPPIRTPSQEASQGIEQLNTSGSGDTQPRISNEFHAAVRYFQRLHNFHSSLVKFCNSKVEF